MLGIDVLVAAVDETVLDGDSPVVIVGVEMVDGDVAVPAVDEKVLDELSVQSALG